MLVLVVIARENSKIQNGHYRNFPGPAMTTKTSIPRGHQVL
jgi:hypothetical protein